MAFDYVEDDILSEKRLSINESISNGFGSSGSSWSGWSSPIESELGSTGRSGSGTESEEEDDFIAELTRQMADYMLEDDDDDEIVTMSMPTTTKKNPNVGFEANQASSYDQTRPIHNFYSENTFQLMECLPTARSLYKLENQPFIKHQGYGCRGRRVKRNELTQQLEPKLQDQKQHHMQNRAEVRGGGFGPSATAGRPRRQQVGSDSGMRAVFLGGPRSRSGPCGTGVFLPRGTGDPPEVRKKSGCSTVLIPARVMQALQHHFEDMNARSQSNGGGGFTSYALQKDVVIEPNTDMHLQHRRQSRSGTGSQAVNQNETVLPKEWTY